MKLAANITIYGVICYLHKINAYHITAACYRKQSTPVVRLPTVVH